MTTSATTSEDLAPRLSAMARRLDAVETRLGALAERTATMEGRLTAIETGLSDLGADLRSELRSGIGLLHTRLDAMQQTTDARLENMQQTTDARLDAINTRLDNMQQETNGRIERVFWAIVGAGVAFVVVGGGIIGALLTVAI